MSSKALKMSSDQESADLADLLARFAAMEAENAKLRDKVERMEQSAITIKTTKYGALSLSGLRSRPVSLYRDEWEAVIADLPRIREYLEKHTGDHADRDADGKPLPIGPAGPVLSKERSYTIFPNDTRAQK